MGHIPIHIVERDPIDPVTITGAGMFVFFEKILNQGHVLHGAKVRLGHRHIAGRTVIFQVNAIGLLFRSVYVFLQN